MLRALLARIGARIRMAQVTRLPLYVQRATPVTPLDQIPPDEGDGSTGAGARADANA
jgi:hypothetical protein